MKEWQEKKDVGFRGYFSPQFVYNQRSDLNMEGMYCRDIMQILSKKGVCYEDQHPYWDLSTPTNEALETAKSYVIKGYARVNTIEGLKRSLKLNGPCLIAFPVFDEESPYMWRNERGVPKEEAMGHAMCVVGYNKEGFIIRNSWGKEWQDDGHCTYPYEDWGAHWEIWTTIDEETNGISFPEKKSTEETDNTITDEEIYDYDEVFFEIISDTPSCCTIV